MSVIHSRSAMAGAGHRTTVPRGFHRIHLLVGVTRPWRVLISVLVVVLAFAGAYLWGHQVVGPHHHQFDLKIYASAVRFWAAGGDLYDYSQPDPVNIRLGFTYPPLAAVLMAPMGSLTPPVISALTTVLIVASTACCVLLCLRERMTLRRASAFVVVGTATAAAFLLEPLRSTVSFGQINTLLMLLVLLDLLVLGRRGSRWTGVGVGLAMAIKLTPGIFLLYLALSRQWRAVAVAVSTAVGATLAAAAVAPTETWRFFTSLLFDNTRVGFLGGAANQSVKGLLARLAAPHPPSSLIWLLVVVAIGVGVGVRIRRAAMTGDTLAAVTLTGLLGILISPASWIHHIVWVIPAAVIVGHRLLTAGVGPLPGSTTVTGELLQRLRDSWRLLLMIALGSLAFAQSSADAFKLPDPDYAGTPVWWRIAASIPMLWCLAACFLLPVRTSVGAPGRLTTRRPEPAARPVSLGAAPASSR